MNRLQVFILTIGFALLAFITNAFGSYTFTIIEITFFASCILMVFSFNQKLPKEEANVDKPQVFQYRQNRLNIYNYMGAFNIAVAISLYLLLKYIDTSRAAIYLFITWVLAAFAFRSIYLKSSLYLFKNNLVGYLIAQSSQSKILNKLSEKQIAEFIEIVDTNYKMSEQELIAEAQLKLKMSKEEAALLYSLTKDYLTLVDDPIKSSELPE